MTERAAHLVDEVIPFVPVRQWVLTLPYRLRYLLAWDHGFERTALAAHPGKAVGQDPAGQELAKLPRDDVIYALVFSAP